jgi:hypothetical protein
MSRTNLRSAQGAKQDEFYTRLEDIENELKKYKSQFENKIIFCNCDDPYESNFFKYFASNFNHLKLKKLIATSHTKSPIVGQQLSLYEIEGLKLEGRQPFKIEINEVPDINKDGVITIEDVKELLKHGKNVVSALKGDGDFRSIESVSLLEECDIVVTNPPFSLFRDFMSLLTSYQKDFLIIGNTNSFTYKEIFKLFKDDKIRTGFTNFNKGMFFVVPSDWEKYHHIDDSGRKIARVSTSCWITNLEVDKHREKMVLYRQYNATDYRSYDNFDAINVDRYLDIPDNYYGVIGVPITYLDKHNPNEFDIVALGNSKENFQPTKVYKNPIKHLKSGDTQNGNAINNVLVFNQKEKPEDVIYYTSDNSDFLIAPYARILIKRKKETNEN